LHLANSKRDLAVSLLVIGALFFAMRSCEYLKTAAEEKKRTKIIRIGNITFKKGNKIIDHSDPELSSSDLVRIRFVFQKNDKRDVCIHMFRSGDKELCPVIAWAHTIQRVRKIQGVTDNTEVCMFQEKITSPPTLIQADHVRIKLRSIVELIGKEILGFDKDDVGLHSIRAGGAMAMFLSGTSVIVIQRVGRWSSEAFLEYIREQVESFTLDVSRNMLKYEEFLNLQNPQEVSSHNIINVGDEDGNENGPESIPFRINFNKLALEHSEG
jgi:hypothetical protein